MKWNNSSTKIKELRKEEIPFITPNFISKNNLLIIINSNKFISDNNKFNYSLKSDILLTCRVPVGVVTINNLEKCWFS